MNLLTNLLRQLKRFKFIQGDSGGPLLCNRNDQFHLVGITSWGDKNCKANIPGVYTRVQSYTKWMEKIMQRPTCV